MKITRIYSDSHGDSHFEDIDIPLREAGQIGSLSDKIPATGMILRETGGDYDFNWHNAPRRQYILMLSGAVKIETSDGKTRFFNTGDILLVEDTTGKGHRSTAVDHQKRISVFITLD